MIDLTFIFVTLSLGVLVLIAYQMKIPRVALPLGIIYIVFVIFGDNPDSAIYNNESETTNNSTDVVREPSPLIVKSRSLRLKQRKVTPKPINFDSGRTAKDIPQIETIKTIEKEDNTIQSIVSNDSQEKVENSHKLIIRDIAICKTIQNRQPIGSDTYFTNLVDSLFCYTRIQNLGAKQEVSHHWYFEDKLIQPISYNVRKSNIYRSWTKKTILPHQIGKWRVDVLDKNDEILASKTFHITQ